VKIAWSDRRCVVCVRERDSGPEGLQTTKGHVIPEALGGRLWSPFLCKDCNSGMGTIEEKLLDDISVIEMVGQLVPVLPQKLALKIRSRAGYFADHPEHGRLYAKPNRSRGDLELITTSEETRSDADVRKQLARRLQANGATDMAIQEALATYDAASAGSEVQLDDGLRVKKHLEVPLDTFSRTYDEPLVPEVVPLGIAYLFAACCIGQQIYDAGFTPLRDLLLKAIREKVDINGTWRIEPLRSTASAAPLHGLALEDTDDGSAVRVVIFRWLVWRVHFPILPRGDEVLFYSRNLETREEESNLA
jgi:hypothetical protein